MFEEVADVACEPYSPYVQDSPRDYSLRRLKQLGEELDAGQLLDGHPLCVYVTGSYGRLEAWEKSDIDPFFLYDSADETQRFPWTSFVRLSARLIDVAQEMDFPPFSKDGKYLEVQYVSEMERVLGSPSDDSLNAFTARMLLLLESQPLHDEAVYLRLLKRIIGFYYRDFEDHADSFLPTFLVNDILRFWRTLTLNYEHHRLGLGTALTEKDLAAEELAKKKADSALKNYKLKVSRLSTCFSMVSNLSAMAPPVKPEQVFDLCRITPAERFTRLSSQSQASGDLVEKLVTVYGEFLEQVQRDEDVLLTEFAEADNRREASASASRYGDLIYALLKEVTPADRMRYLVI
ncbi:MAG TPA: DUF294 nucleotidyltransferase-like domain-containing protein [Solirubrobacterales bacterium]